MIDLFTAATPNGHKISIALEELGLPYKVRTLKLGENEQKQLWFLGLNPNGRIPAIVDRSANDFVVFESGAILIYLAEKMGRLLPEAPRDRSRVLQWLMFQMGGVGPMMGQAKVFGHLFPEKVPAAIERYQNESRRLLGVLDQHLALHEYLAGDYSIADIATWPWVRNHQWSGVSLETLPHLQRWLDVIGQRPAVQRGILQPPSTMGTAPPEKSSPDKSEPVAAKRPVMPAPAQPARDFRSAAAVAKAPFRRPAASNIEVVSTRTDSATQVCHPRDLHQVRDLVVIALAGALAGLADWASIADFAQESAPWLRGHLDLAADLPSQSVFNQVFGRMDTVAFASALGGWEKAGRPLRDGAVAGSALLMSQADELQWVLGLSAAGDHGHDVDALMAALELKGALVCVQSTGVRPEVAQAVHAQGGHYLLAIQDDPLWPAMVEEIRQWLSYCDAARCGQVADKVSRNADGAECQQVVVSQEVEWLSGRADWVDLQAVARISTQRQVEGQARVEHQHVLCSLADPRRILELATPGGLLPGRLMEIKFPGRSDHLRSAANLAAIRRLALQILNRDGFLPELSVRRRMMRAQANPYYLQSLLLPIDGSPYFEDED